MFNLHLTYLHLRECEIKTNHFEICVGAVDGKFETLIEYWICRTCPLVNHESEPDRTVVPMPMGSKHKKMGIIEKSPNIIRFHRIDSWSLRLIFGTSYAVVASGVSDIEPTHHCIMARLIWLGRKQICILVNRPYGLIKTESCITYGCSNVDAGRHCWQIPHLIHLISNRIIVIIIMYVNVIIVIIFKYRCVYVWMKISWNSSELDIIWMHAWIPYERPIWQPLNHLTHAIRARRMYCVCLRAFSICLVKCAQRHS